MSAREIYLRKRSKVLVDAGQSDQPDALVGAFAKNLESLGYTISKGLWGRLKTLSVPQISNLYNDITSILKEMVGANQQFKPFYPNFPKQVMETSELELYINAIVHYWFTDTADKQVLPNYEKEDRPALDEKTTLKVIDLGDLADFESIFTKLVSSNGSISESDKETVGWFIETYQDNIKPLVPHVIPQKEQLAYVISKCFSQLSDCSFLTSRLKTATDVLRVAVALSGGDVSLAAPTKFKSFPRKERRFFVSALAGCGAITEDMLRWKNRWIRLGHGLHVSEYMEAYPEVHNAFDVLRNDKPYATFASKVEKAIKAKKSEEVVELLKTRPGDFARRLDHLLRLFSNSTTQQHDILNDFSRVANQVSTPVLLQLYHHFGTRDPNRIRSFFPKGNTSKIQVSEAALPEINFGTTFSASKYAEEILTERFKQLPPLGNVYLDENLLNYKVPFAQRSASKSLRTISRGSKVSLPENTKTVRFFIWWKNGKERTDIDLSAGIFTDKWRHHIDIGFYNLKDGACAHSGDIVSAPNGACEFIDIDIDRVLKAGGRYVVMSIHSFTSQPFCELPECFGGWMGREKPNSGEVFEAKTVLDKVDVASNANACIPVIIDLAERQVVWTDLALSGMRGRRTLHSDRATVEKIGRAMLDLNKPSLYDLLLMHVRARGTRVATKEEADVVFSINEGITPFDGDKILSEFLV